MPVYFKTQEKELKYDHLCSCQKTIHVGQEKKKGGGGREGKEREKEEEKEKGKRKKTAIPLKTFLEPTVGLIVVINVITQVKCNLPLKLPGFQIL